MTGCSESPFSKEEMRILALQDQRALNENFDRSSSSATTPFKVVSSGGE